MILFVSAVNKKFTEYVFLQIKQMIFFHMIENLIWSHNLGVIKM